MQSTTADPIREERRVLMRFARHLCRSGSDADDLVQETLLRVWRHQPTFPSEGHRRAWLKRVLLNNHIDARRRDRRAGDWCLRSSHEDRVSASMAQPDEISGAMQRNFDQLPVDYRNVLFVVDVCEQSYQEAADQLGCPIGTVMSRLHRARRLLRQRLDREQAPADAAKRHELVEDVVAA